MLEHRAPKTSPPILHTRGVESKVGRAVHCAPVWVVQNQLLGLESCRPRPYECGYELLVCWWMKHAVDPGCGGQRTARPTRDRVFRKQRPSKKDGKRNRTCARLKMRRRQPQISDDAVTKLNIGWKSAFHSPDICRVHACRQGFGHGYGSGAMWQLKSFVLRTCNPSRLVQFTIKTSVAQPATCRPPIMSRAMRASRLAVCNCLL